LFPTIAWQKFWHQLERLVFFLRDLPEKSKGNCTFSWSKEIRKNQKPTSRVKKKAATLQLVFFF
jgi:hypothetical protein